MAPPRAATRPHIRPALPHGTLQGIVWSGRELIRPHLHAGTVHATGVLQPVGSEQPHVYHQEGVHVAIDYCRDYRLIEHAGCLSGSIMATSGTMLRSNGK